MKAHNIFRKVGSILAEINEQYQYLSDSPEKFNELELELLSANADFLAEHIKVLRKLNPNPLDFPAETNENPADVSHTPEYKESVSSPDVIEDAADLIKQDVPEAYANFDKPIENEIPAATAATGNFNILPESEPVKTVDETESAIESISEPLAEPTVGHSFNSFFIPEAKPSNQLPQENLQTSIEETVTDEVVEHVVPASLNQNEEAVKIPTLNEMISAQRQEASPFARPQQPVSDLKSIINLNDKLLFIKDLFNGYSLAYSEAIEIINRFDSFEAADNFLKTNYSVKNNWVSKQHTVDKFYELLNRRFAK